VQSRAAAWLVDEELWRQPAEKTDPTPNAGSPYVSAAAVESATTQHVNALHALRTSSITHGVGGSSSSGNARAKHWGAVALPLPLHVVTAPAAATGGVTVEEVRASGEWKGLRGSFNRSVDGPLEPGKTKDTTGALNADTLSQRLLTDAKLFRPLASQWAKGELFSVVLKTLNVSPPAQS
jgi:hypothetical protein